MSFFGTLGRIGEGLGSGGLSELYRSKYGQDPLSAGYNKLKHANWGWMGNESQSKQDQRNNLNQQGQQASQFANVGQQGYGQMTQESQQARDYLRDLVSGKNSVAAEQLRQGTQQGLAAQQSMAAGASPQNAAMAARNAAMNMGRLSSGMTGQAAVAGLQERNQAQQNLSNMIMQQRGQDMGVALGSRQNATSAYGGVTPEGSFMDKYANPAASAASAAAKFSDRLLKQDIRSGDGAANAALSSLGQRPAMASRDQGIADVGTFFSPENEARRKAAPQFWARPEQQAKLAEMQRRRDDTAARNDNFRSLAPGSGGDPDAALKGLRAYTYNYKDPKLGAGKQVGIMAQDLEKAGLGHTVIDTPRGKAVDTGALSTANAAMLAALEKRVAGLEGAKK